MTNLLTTDDVIRALGGPTEVGKLVSRKPQVVNHWRSKNSGKFPSWTILLLQDALKQKDRSLQASSALWGVPEPKSKRASA